MERLGITVSEVHQMASDLLDNMIKLSLGLKTREEVKAQGKLENWGSIVTIAVG